MKLLIDMNLSPAWVEFFSRHGWESVHWSDVGDPRAQDKDVMQWAARNGYVVFTHDLDFGSMLAVTGSSGPSIVQIRTEDVLPEHLGPILIPVLRQHQDLLETGALIVIDPYRARMRILPLAP